MTDLIIAKIDAHRVIVTGGTLNGDKEFVKAGETITITADEPTDGKVFKGWKDGNGEIVSTDKNYTFTVSGEVNLTAVYDDLSSSEIETGGSGKESGTISGGKIAGIVIGTMLLAGIGGFAIFWFAVKRKTFADLGAAIKASFGKKK
ncbi:MAG: hypothetical protein SO386_06440 [Eubacteriales bacterium]|nr:hypothetical protein [Eubacteriales bacterium]